MKLFPRLFLLIATILGPLGNVLPAPTPPASAPQPVAPPDTPARWDAALFVPNSVPDEVLRKIEGASMQLNAFPLLRLSVLKAIAKFDYGTAQVSIILGVGTADAPKTAQLEAVGTLTFSRFERDPGGSNPRANFRIRLETLKPSIAAGGKQLDPGNLTPILEKAGLLNLLADFLSFSIPIPLDLTGEAKFDDDLTFKAEKDGQVRARVRAPGRAIAAKVTGLRVVFVPSGVWLCSQFGREQQADERGTNLPPSERWKFYEESATKENARLFVRGLSLVDIFDRLGGAQRATIKGVNHANKLRDGEASVWLADDSEAGSLTITPKARWTSDGALKVECSYTATATAHLGINLKFPGGSVGTRSVECNGKSQGVVEAQLIATVFPNGTQASQDFCPRAAVLLPEFGAKGNQFQQLWLHVETDGRFKTKLPFHSYLKTNAPKVEVDAKIPVPPDILPHLSLLTNEPHLIRYPKPPSGFTVNAPKGGLPTHAVLEPQRASWDDDGYVLEFKFMLTTLTAEQAATHTSAIRKMLHDIRTSTLKVGEINVTVGGIGPNNTLVKILMEFGKAVAVAYEEAKKAGKNVEATVAKAENDISTEVARIPKNIERAPRNVEREIGTFASKNGIKGVKIPKVIKVPSANQLPGFIKNNLPKKPSDLLPKKPLEIFKKPSLRKPFG